MKRSFQNIERVARRRAVFVAWAAARLSSRDDAEDVVQRALARASARADQLDDPSSAEAWFWQILRRTLYDFLAERGRNADRLEKLASFAPTESPEPDDDVCPCGVEELESISETLRDAVVRVDLYDETAAEAAEALGISESAARVRVHRGRKELRSRIEERCDISSAEEMHHCACC